MVATSGALWTLLMGCGHAIFFRTIPSFPSVELDLYNRMRALKVLQKVQIICKSFKVTVWPSKVLQKAQIICKSFKVTVWPAEGLPSWGCTSCPAGEELNHNTVEREEQKVKA